MASYIISCYTRGLTLWRRCWSVPTVRWSTVLTHIESPRSFLNDRVLEWPVKGTAVALAWRCGGDIFEDGVSPRMQDTL